MTMNQDADTMDLDRFDMTDVTREQALAMWDAATRVSRPVPHGGSSSGAKVRVFGLTRPRNTVGENASNRVAVS